MKFSTTIEFEVDNRVSKSELRNFIIEWLSSGGGCRSPDDLLFDSLQRIKVGGFKRLDIIRKPKKQKFCY